MKVLLFLNGHKGCQPGIENGFSYLKEIGKIIDLKWFYFNHHVKTNSVSKTTTKMMELAELFQPNLVVFFHIGDFKIKLETIKNIKNISSKPIVVYDEGDMYGTWAKRIPLHMKMLIKNVDVISIRGFGKFYKYIKKLNKNIIYTPQHNDIERFSLSKIKKDRQLDIVLIGNKVKPRILSSIRRQPGAKGREKLISKLVKNFPLNFELFGNGWENYNCYKGAIDLYKQHEIYQNTWITVAYDHYPQIPYYFSNRLPIALMNGTLYVCNYHKGYENIFPNCDFIFFFKTNQEAIDILNYLLSLSKKELLQRSQHAREFALRHFHPNVIWMNFVNNIEKYNIK